MTQINLLPWREQKKTEQKIIFAMMLATSCLAGLFFVLVIHVYMDFKISHQLKRNDYLQSVINDESVEIATLNIQQKKLQAMEAQLDFLESLRQQSWQAVKLLDTLPRVMPDAVTLDKMVREGNQITLLGKSLSSLQVTLLMENLAKSLVFNQPVLTDLNSKESQTGDEKLFQIETDQKE